MTNQTADRAPAFSKAKVRGEMLAARRALSAKQAAHMSDRICERILSGAHYRETDCILAYMAVRNEVSVDAVIRQALADGKEVYLPAVCGNEMKFYRMRGFDKLREGAFHIPEPMRTEPFDKAAGLLLVPGVAYTRECMRLGFGGGYYDRFFANNRASLYLLAPAYGMQLTNKTILWEPTDRPVDAVLTENAVYIKYENKMEEQHEFQATKAGRETGRTNDARNKG